MFYDKSYIHTIIYAQGALQFELVGEPPSPEFFQVDVATGVITIKKNLMEDYSPYYVVG